MIDPTKHNFIQPLSVKETKNVKSKDDYYRALPKSEDEELELDTMKSNDKAYLSNRKCSVQNTFRSYSEFKLKRIFPAVYFFNTNPPKERV